MPLHNSALDAPTCPSRPRAHPPRAPCEARRHVTWPNINNLRLRPRLPRRIPPLARRRRVGKDSNNTRLYIYIVHCSQCRALPAHRCTLSCPSRAGKRSRVLTAPIKMVEQSPGSCHQKRPSRSSRHINFLFQTMTSLDNGNHLDTARVARFPLPMHALPLVL